MDAEPATEFRRPTKGTLRKYGLTLDEWISILKRQGDVCAVCGRVSPTGRSVIDHEHVPGWKKLKPEHRRWFVRGVICSFCNSHVVGRFVTLDKARRVVAYLSAFEVRKGML